MSLEISYDDVKELQISLRKEAGLASYNPEDPELPNLPSAQDAISQLDPSPDYLRCKHCKGRLLRGINSIICVFCGRQQHAKDVPPEPIKFLSTFCSRWFLQSLDLDGSELVDLPDEANESNRGQNTPKNELALSDLLNLEIKWHSESEKLESGVSEKTPDQKLSTLNLAGVDLDNFFGEDKIESVSVPPEEQLARIRQNYATENNAIQGYGNVNLFENALLSEKVATLKEDGSFESHRSPDLFEKIQPSVSVVKSEEDESSDAFSGWEAEFQSAGSGAQHQESKLSDPLAASSSADLSAHMDSVFGSGNENIAPSASNTDDWFNDDPWSNSNSLPTSQAEQLKAPVSNRKGDLMENAVHSSPVNMDLIQENQWQMASKNTADNKIIDEDDDWFNSDQWSDSNSLPTSQAEQFKVPVSNRKGGPMENTVHSSSVNMDLIQENQWQMASSNTADNKITDEDNDWFNGDQWSNSNSLPTSQAEQFKVPASNRKGGLMENTVHSSPVNMDGVQENQWQMASSNTVDNKIIDEDNDWFNGDPWSNSNSVPTSQAEQFKVPVSNRKGRPIESTVHSASANMDLIQENQWQMASSNTADNKIIDEDNDWFNSDPWSNSNSLPTSLAEQFKVPVSNRKGGLMENTVHSSSVNMDWIQENQWQKASSNTDDNKIIDEDDDSFDSWNDFTSCPNMQASSTNSSSEVVHHGIPSLERASETTFFGSNNQSKDFDFGSFSQADFFAGKNNNQTNSTGVAQPETSVSDRVDFINVRGEIAEEPEKSNDVYNGDLRSKADDVERLISQMHDLSFMLESNLSIPQKMDP